MLLKSLLKNDESLMTFMLVEFSLNSYEIYSKKKEEEKRIVIVQWLCFVVHDNNDENKDVCCRKGSEYIMLLKRAQSRGRIHE